jgi:hypothetical protein
MKKCPKCRGMGIINPFEGTTMVGIVLKSPKCSVCSGRRYVGQEEFDRYVPKSTERSFDPALAAYITELMRLAKLRDEGVITQDEYERAVGELSGDS